MVVVSVAVLSLRSASSALVDTDAVFVTVPTSVGWTTRSMVPDAAGASVPGAQGTVPESSVQLPVDGVADPGDAPAGSGSVTLTSVASSSPAFMAVRWYVMSEPSTTGS